MRPRLVPPAAVAAALLVGVATFLVRFNAMGEGVLAGFENDEFLYLMRAQLVNAGEWPLRDFPDAELQGAWPSLMYAAPAWAQRVWGPTLLAEAYLTIGALAACSALVFWLARDLSDSWLMAALAAAALWVTEPRLYNYPKVFALAAGAAAVRWLARDTTWRPVVGAAVVAAVAAVYRHDLAVYAAAGATAAMAASETSWRDRLRRLALYGGVTTLLLTPSIVWVQRYEGVGAYVRAALETSRAESVRTRLSWPALSGTLDEQTLIAMTYYACWLALVVAAVFVARTPKGARRSPAMATGLGLVAMTVLVNLLFLRANLPARVGDAAAAVALTAAWAAGQARWGPGAARLVWAVPRVLLAVIVAAAFTSNRVSVDVGRSGVLAGPGAVADRFADVRARLAALPPPSWAGMPAYGTLLASQYLAECTAADDRLLLTTYTPEVPVMANRLVAGGQRFGFSLYRSDAVQRALLNRLQRQSVPIVLGSATQYDEFVEDYPIVARHVTDHYREVEPMVIEGQPRFRVFADRNLAPTGTHAPTGLPCFR